MGFVGLAKKGRNYFPPRVLRLRTQVSTVVLSVKSTRSQAHAIIMI